MLQVEAPGIHYSIKVAKSEKQGGMFRVTKEVLGKQGGASVAIGGDVHKSPRGLGTLSRTRMTTRTFFCA